MQPQWVLLFHEACKKGSQGETPGPAYATSCFSALLCSLQTSSKASETHEDLFPKYKESSEDSIGPEGTLPGKLSISACTVLHIISCRERLFTAAGVEKLCRDLQVDPADRKVSRVCNGCVSEFCILSMRLLYLPWPFALLFLLTPSQYV